MSVISLGAEVCLPPSAAIGNSSQSINHCHAKSYRDKKRRERKNAVVENEVSRSFEGIIISMEQ